MIVVDDRSHFGPGLGGVTRLEFDLACHPGEAESHLRVDPLLQPERCALGMQQPLRLRQPAPPQGRPELDALEVCAESERGF